MYIVCHTDSWHEKGKSDIAELTLQRPVMCVSGFISPEGAAWYWKEHQLGEQIVYLTH